MKPRCITRMHKSEGPKCSILTILKDNKKIKIKVLRKLKSVQHNKERCIHTTEGISKMNCLHIANKCLMHIYCEFYIQKSIRSLCQAANFLLFRPTIIS